jgi:GMP synthase-like glutamine amidotransferase
MEEIGLVNMNPVKKPQVFLETLRSLQCRVEVLDATELSNRELFIRIQRSRISKWICTGSPSSIYDPNSPSLPMELFDLPDKQFFLICYSMEYVLKKLGYQVLKRQENKRETFVLVHATQLLRNPATLYRNHQYYTPAKSIPFFVAEHQGEAMIVRYKQTIMTQFHPERSDDGKQMLFQWIHEERPSSER